MEVNELDPILPTAREAPADAPQDTNVRDAARLLASLRKPKQEEAAAHEAAPEPELSAEDNVAPPIEEPSGETTQEVDPVEASQEPEPSIDPPRSWTTEDKETFRSLPRETQERLVSIDRDRELAVRKVQNETADQRKKLDERLKEAETVRKQYEEALPTILNVLHQAQLGEFADVKSPVDERRLASEDPVRYMQFLARQREVAMAQQELALSQQRQQQEQTSAWQTFASKEDALFAERHPEFKGPEAAKASQEVISMLEAEGFTRDEIAQEYNNNKAMRDHRMQSILWKAARYDKAQKAVKATPKKALPPVQHPGVASAPKSAAQHKSEELQKRFADKPSAKNAAELLTQLRRARKA